MCQVTSHQPTQKTETITHDNHPTVLNRTAKWHSDILVFFISLFSLRTERVSHIKAGRSDISPKIKIKIKIKIKDAHAASTPSPKASNLTARLKVSLKKRIRKRELKIKIKIKIKKRELKGGGGHRIKKEIRS